MEWNLIVFAILSVTGAAHGQMQLVSEARSVTISGFANAHGQGNPHSSYSQSLSPSLPFSSFISEVSSNVSSFNPGGGPNGLDVSALAGSRAWQDSLISPSQFRVLTEISSESSSLLPTWPGVCRGEASSLFEVTFTVPVTQTYELTLDRFRFAHSFPSIDSGLSLTPVGEDAILNLPLSQFSNGQTFTGILDPGKVYTLNLFSTSSSSTPDPFGELGNLRSEMTFTVVPEPSSLILLGIALGTIVTVRLIRRVPNS